MRKIGIDVAVHRGLQEITVMRRLRLQRPTVATAVTFFAAAAAAALIGVTTDARETRHFSLDSAAGLRLNNVTAEPAVLQGKKGLRVAMSEERVRQFQAMTADQQADAQARVGQYAVVEGVEIGNG